MLAETVESPQVTLEAASLRSVFSCFPSGVVAMCATDPTAGPGERPHGMICSSFTSVSIDPPLVSVYILEGSSTWAHLRQADRIGISVLSEQHSVAARQLAVKVPDRFAGLEWRLTPSGAILLDDAAATFECSVELEQVIGDHTLVVLRVHDIEETRNISPLVFHHSRFKKIPTP